MAGCIQPVSLQANCGFCRVAIYEITNAKGGRQGINKDDRTTFQNMFADIPKFGLEENYIPDGLRPSKFNRHCDSILDTIKRKWHPQEAKHAYLEIFLVDKWKSLPAKNKEKHSISECQGCLQKDYIELENVYPGKPIYNPSVVIIDAAMTHKMGTTTFTERCTKDLEQVYQDTVGILYIYAVKKHLKAQGQKDPYKRKMRYCKLQQKFGDHVNKQLADQATLFHLAENESKKLAGRKRRSQGFSTPPSSPSSEPAQKKPKSHCPNLESVEWDKQAVLADISNWPEGKPMNWSKFG